MGAFKVILRYVSAYKKAALLTPLFTGLEVIMDVLIPYAIALLIDRGIQASDMQAVLIYGALMLVMAFAALLFGVLAGRYAAKASTGFGANLRNAMFTNVQTFSFSNIDKFSTSSLVTRMTVDVTNVQNAFMMIIRVAVRAPLTLIVSLVMCLVISPSMSTIFLIAIAILLVFIVLFMTRITKIFRQVFEKYDELNESVQENVSAIRVVKAFVREEYEKSKFNAAVQNLYRLFVKAEGMLALAGPLMMLIVYGCIILLSWFGAQAVVGGTLSTGDLTALLTYVMSIFMSLMMLSMIFVMITMSMASAQRIAEVLEETPDIANPRDPIYEVKDGAIDFDHVTFAYRQQTGEAAVGKATLRDIDVHIKSGETIGIVGGTGSGKTTLVSLICRLYDVDQGAVRVGGVDVRAYDTEALRSQVAVVLQKNELFTGTIYENLRWGNEHATDEECQEACRIACADEFIARFPDGYDTRIEQGGVNVSGGQKQRLCIARALLKNPKVLILDDSTSAVDTATDARIRERLATLMPATTKLIIAQRIQSVQEADRIVVLDDGEVCGFGTHEDLLATNDVYAEIYETQMRAGGDFDEPQPDAFEALEFATAVTVPPARGAVLRGGER